MFCWRTGERGEEDESGDESGLRSEAPHERVAQQVFPLAAIREPSPGAVAGEEPVCPDGKGGGKHAGVEDER